MESMGKLLIMVQSGNYKGNDLDALRAIAFGAPALPEPSAMAFFLFAAVLWESTSVPHAVPWTKWLCYQRDHMP